MWLDVFQLHFLFCGFSGNNNNVISVCFGFSYQFGICSKMFHESFAKRLGLTVLDRARPPRSCCLLLSKASTRGASLPYVHRSSVSQFAYFHTYTCYFENVRVRSRCRVLKCSVLRVSGLTQWSVGYVAEEEGAPTLG